MKRFCLMLVFALGCALVAAGHSDTGVTKQAPKQEQVCAVDHQDIAVDVIIANFDAAEMPVGVVVPRPDLGRRSPYVTLGSERIHSGYYAVIRPPPDGAFNVRV